MKKLFALLAVVLAVVSCQKDAGLDVNVGGEQLVNITVALPEATRADSAVGALKNNVLTGHNLRFILEIYNVDTKGDIDYTDCYRKQSIGKDTYTSFPVRLVPGHEYKIVVWADFVQNDVDTYYNTANGLDEITFIAGKDTAMTEARDAYYAVYTLESNKTASSIPTLTLKRPFAKIRVITTDLDECAEMSDMIPTQATITYTSTVNDKFNAVNKQVYSVSPNSVKTVKYPSVYGDASTLFVDYILVDQFNPSAVNFNLNTDIVERPFNTDIAVEANKLTTITGNILTDGTNIEVKVDGEFNEPGNTVEVVWVSDATELTSALNTPNAEVVLTTDITLDQPLSITNNATIDGNGNAFIYTGNGDRVIDIRDIATRTANNGTVVTIKNLSIDLGNKSYERGINYNSNGKLILDNVKVVGTDVTYALNLPGLSDNCEVEINNCEFKGIIALNVWGENAVINVNNSILTSVDNSTAEDYAAINLNKDAEGTVVNVNGGKIIAKNENGEPSAASNNATVSGKINISKTTEVIGYKLFPVATVTYTTTDDYYTCTTLQEAIDTAKNNNTATVTLIKDIESSEIITVSGNATINGNGHTITSSARRAILIDSSNANVVINDLNIVVTTERVGTNDVRGINIDAKLSNVELTLNNCSVDFTHKTGNDWTYAVNVSGNGTGHKVTVNGGTYEGANVINAWGANNTINVKNTTLTSLYPNSDVYYGACIWVLQKQNSSVYAEGNTFNGDNAIAFNLGTGTALEEKNNTDNTTRFVANGLYKDTNKAYVVTNAEGLATLNAKMVDFSAGEGIFVNINADIDFTGKTWTPVKSHVDWKCYLRELNGNGHTISNLTINGQAMFTVFAGLGDVTIKDITFDNAKVNSNGNINTSILTVQSYQNVLLDNVDVKNSSIIGGYKVAPLIATVYNEDPSTVTATLKNCDVENTTVKATSYDFCTTGMVAFVNAGDNDAITFENCTVSNVKLYAPNVYTAHAAVYTTGSETLYNEVKGVTVTNFTFENI